MDVVILAAGKGTRMKTNLLKVLHKVGGKTLLEHVVALSKKIKASRSVIVVPDHNTSIQETLQDNTLIYAVQKKQLGTGDALKAALSCIKKTSREILVMNGDMPFVSSSSITKLLQTHRKNKATVTILTVHVQKENGFGRIIRDGKGAVTGIVEVKDATKEQLNITETNVGVYLFDADFVNKSIASLQNRNAQKEYYITDLIALAVKKNHTVCGVPLKDHEESLGVNSQMDLACLNDVFYKRQRFKFMSDGVSILGSEVFIDADVRIGSGSVLMSPCYLQGATKLGQNVVIETGCFIKDSQIDANVHMKAYCYVTESRMAQGCQIGPFAHLRPKTELAADVKIGNFVETKKSKINAKSKVSHLSYIGDALIGKNVNIGAGTITCNYDGYTKFETILDDDVFIGSDTQLVAPVHVGRGAFVGAGTTVTKDVAPDSLAVSRVQQKEIHGWAKHKRKKYSAK